MNEMERNKNANNSNKFKKGWAKLLFLLIISKATPGWPCYPNRNVIEQNINHSQE
jgi:hypothetical protein